jgi:hypothetical protein
LRQADLTTAVIIRVMTSEIPARETPTMAVAVLMSEGYAGLLPPHTATSMSDPANPMMAAHDAHQPTVRTSVRPSPRSSRPHLAAKVARRRRILTQTCAGDVGDVGVRLLGPNLASPHPSDHDHLLDDAGFLAHNDGTRLGVRASGVRHPEDWRTLLPD